MKNNNIEEIKVTINFVDLTDQLEKSNKPQKNHRKTQYFKLFSDSFIMKKFLRNLI